MQFRMLTSIYPKLTATSLFSATLQDNTYQPITRHFFKVIFYQQFEKHYLSDIKLCGFPKHRDYRK